MWHSTIQSVSSPNYKQNFKKAKSIKPYTALNSGIKAYKAHHQDTQFRHQSLKRHQVTQFSINSLLLDTNSLNSGIKDHTSTLFRQQSTLFEQQSQP